MRFGIVILLTLAPLVSASSVESWLEDAKEATRGGKGKIWAVLVAGSSQYYNYRHQADVSHLYQLLTKKHGLPPQQVIVMMMNDIAYNPQNPTPGIIVNALHGQDVYEGMMIDYMQGDVTPENFLQILKGWRMGHGSMKTLASGPDDYVFVNFVDHGDTGILGFPNDMLHLEDLMNTLHIMQRTKKYKQMLWYVEACYSGSMFEHLPPNMNITAHTAANNDESSWACVFDSLRGVYLGDCWSLNWLNNTEQIFPRLYSETVEEQYEAVKKMTVQSHPSIYGDLDIIYHEKISTFLGHGEQGEMSVASSPVSRDIVQGAMIPSQDVLLDTLYRQRANAYPARDADLEALIKHHEATETEVVKVVGDIVMKMVRGEPALVTYFRDSRQKIHHPACNKEVMSTFYTSCWRFQEHPYITKYTYMISNLCNSYGSEEIVETILSTCTNDN